MIQEVAFGRIVVDGKTYGSDLILLPDGTVRDNWWRASGHRLAPGDIADLVASAPEVIVVGTGVYGRMVPDPEVAVHLAANGIEMIAAANAEAKEAFNRLAAAGKKVGACFHLTC